MFYFFTNCFTFCWQGHNLILLLGFYEKCCDLFQKPREIFEPREKKSEGKLKVFKILTSGVHFH